MIPSPSPAAVARPDHRLTLSSAPTALEAAVALVQPVVEALAASLGWERRTALLVTLAVVGDRRDLPVFLDSAETQRAAWTAAAQLLDADDPDLFDVGAWGGWPTPLPAAAHQHAAAAGYPSLYSSLAADGWEDTAAGLAAILDASCPVVLRMLAQAVCERWGVPAPQFSPPAGAAPPDA